MKVELTDHHHWRVSAMRITFVQTSGEVTSFDVHVSSIPSIPVGSSFHSRKHWLGYTGTSLEAKSTITVLFYDLQASSSSSSSVSEGG